ncbi:hypothetical protein L8C07_17745 [Paenibacillus sp. CMAA1739]|uniref:hypothetical protein n=1 Tax=Paenibacillus ottowii TaxID=2315729 RepID=UPI00273117D2|nr:MULTISPECIES: hypothetical protein [Paenibacillus]MDP1511497.1 hypothetical protein [Paenibacillus ottowii]MEC4567795.1 hypothetical protein [Paenibacillus sp. CMAA1739]
MTFPIVGDLYNRIFEIQQSHPDLEVDYAIWNRINTSLPEDYKLPDADILERLKQSAP